MPSGVQSTPPYRPLSATLRAYPFWLNLNLCRYWDDFSRVLELITQIDWALINFKSRKKQKARSFERAFMIMPAIT
jgi:hypothetical protein